MGIAILTPMVTDCYKYLGIQLPPLKWLQEQHQKEHEIVYVHENLMECIVYFHSQSNPICIPNVLMESLKGNLDLYRAGLG